MGGVRFGGASPLSFGAELRYQAGKGDLEDERFLAERVDLGGYTVQAGFVISF
jgi:hypothetical protein